MVRPQQKGSLQKLPSFAIKDILGLPDDADNSTRPTQQTSALVIAQTSATYQRFVCHARPSIWSEYWSRRPRKMGKSSSMLLAPGFRFAEDISKGTGLIPRGNKYELNFRAFVPTRKKKQRPLFSPRQVQKMEEEFEARKYLSEVKRAELAQELELTETQVKTWFQNRRTKWRKELRNENPPREVPDGRLKGLWRQDDEARKI